MLKTLIPALAVVLGVSLTAGPTAEAGKARSGRVTGSKVGGLSKAARKLVGTWRMVAFEVGTTRRPFPGSMAYTVVLRGDGTLSMKNVPQAAKYKKARWSVKGKHVLLTQGKKVQKLGYSFKANELSVTMPGNTKIRIIMQRVSTKVKP